MKRYPHTAQIILEVETLAATVPDDGILGRSKGSEQVYEIEGRYEDSDSSTSKYTGIFYARSFPQYQLIGTDNAKMVIAGRSFDVLRLIPHQTHVEIWLS